MHFFILVAVLFKVPTVFSADGCKDMMFIVTNKLEALVNHVISTERATDDSHCETKCFFDDRCISYNYGRDATGKLEMCELNDADHVMHPEDLVPRPDTVYRMVENSCNCSKFEICRHDFVTMTHKCECKSGHTLEKCNASYLVKNCKKFNDRREDFKLDSIDSLTAKGSVCRMLLDPSGSSGVHPYNLTVNMRLSWSNGSRVTFPGMGFNVQDEDNFDFVFLRTRDKIRGPGYCLQVGKVRDNIKKFISTRNCTVPLFPAYVWFKISVAVTQHSTAVYLNGKFVIKFKPAFPLKPKGAVVLINGYKNSLRFKEYQCSAI